MTMFNNVFISYASEDYTSAESLFDFLVKNDFDPWLDKKHILPGQDWNSEIRLALKKADFVILLLSNVSVRKRGYVQREFKIAIEYCEERIPGDIYIIPCKLDNCEPPAELLKYQWVELNSPNSFTLILNSLLSQQKTYLKNLQLKAPPDSTFEYEEFEVHESVGVESQVTNSAVYPQFTSINNQELRMLNNFIEYEVYQKKNDFNGILGLYRDNTLPKGIMNRILSIDLSYKVEVHNKDYVSVAIFVSTYDGGAYGHYTTCGYNFRLHPLIQISASMLFDNRGEVLKSLVQLCKQKLWKKAKQDGIDKEEDCFLSADPIPSTWTTFDNFLLTKRSIIIFWIPFQINVLGGHKGLELELEFKELFDLYYDLRTLARVKESLCE